MSRYLRGLPVDRMTRGGCTYLNIPYWILQSMQQYVDYDDIYQYIYLLHTLITYLLCMFTIDMMDDASHARTHAQDGHVLRWFVGLPSSLAHDPHKVRPAIRPAISLRGHLSLKSYNSSLRCFHENRHRCLNSSCSPPFACVN